MLILLWDPMNTTQGDNVSYWDLEWHMPSNIGDTKALTEKSLCCFPVAPNSQR